MKKPEHTATARRTFLRACLAMPATFVLAACAGQSAGEATPQPAAPSPPAPTNAPAPPTPTTLPPTALPPPTVAPTQPPPTVAPTQPPPTQPPTQAAPPVALQPTPACDDGDDETPAQTEGPYYTPNTPERASLIEPGITGTRLVVSGHVLTTGCTPVARALLDFWHCDDGGAYDNAGYRLRGHQFTDDQGRYTLETIMPGLYTGRTRHIHVKVQAPNQAVLTTQLYFPDEPGNNSDGIFRPELVMQVQDAADGKAGAFDFVLNV